MGLAAVLRAEPDEHDAPRAGPPRPPRAARRSTARPRASRSAARPSRRSARRTCAPRRAAHVPGRAEGEERGRLRLHAEAERLRRVDVELSSEPGQKNLSAGRSRSTFLTGSFSASIASCDDASSATSVPPASTNALQRRDARLPEPARVLLRAATPRGCRRSADAPASTAARSLEFGARGSPRRMSASRTSCTANPCCSSTQRVHPSSMASDHGRYSPTRARATGQRRGRPRPSRRTRAGRAGARAPSTTRFARGARRGTSERARRVASTAVGSDASPAVHSGLQRPPPAAGWPRRRRALPARIDDVEVRLGARRPRSGRRAAARSTRDVTGGSNAASIAIDPDAHLQRQRPAGDVVRPLGRRPRRGRRRDSAAARAASWRRRGTAAPSARCPCRRGTARRPALNGSCACSTSTPPSAAGSTSFAAAARVVLVGRDDERERLRRRRRGATARRPIV